VNDLTRDSDRILSESKALVRDNREGGRHRRAPSIGQGSAKAKRDHLLKKVRNVVIAVFAIWLASGVAGAIFSGIGFWGVMVSVLFFGSHGAWAGGIRGISHANYHLKPYLDDIRKGRYLIIVDVDREEQRKKVHRLLDHSLDAERQGDESAFSPLL